MSHGDIKYKQGFTKRSQTPIIDNGFTTENGSSQIGKVTFNHLFILQGFQIDFGFP